MKRFSSSLAAIVSAMVIVGGAAGIAAAHSASHRTSGKSPMFVQVVSKVYFDQTVSQLKHAIAANGMMVLGTLDQKGALSTTGLNLKGAESFFVGNPVMGKKFFMADAAIGVEVPVRLYVWVNAQHRTEIGYYNPAVLFKAVNPKLAMAGRQLAMMIGKIAAEAAR